MAEDPANILKVTTDPGDANAAIVEFDLDIVQVGAFENITVDGWSPTEHSRDGLPLNKLRLFFDYEVIVTAHWEAFFPDEDWIFSNGGTTYNPNEGDVVPGYRPPHPGMEGGMQHLDGGIGG